MMRAQEVSRIRLRVVGVVVVALFASLFTRLYYLQVLASPSFVVRAEQNELRSVPLSPVRGRIVDRNGVVLADNVVVGEVVLDRDVMRELDTEHRLGELFERLGPVVGLTAEELAIRYEDPNDDPLRPVVVLEDADEATLVYLKERQREFPGVIARQGLRRVYPFGPVAAHVVGYVGEISPDGFGGEPGPPYRPGDEIGKVGVERIFERDLRGEPGLERFEVDRQGNTVGRRIEEEPAPGRDLALTIDVRVQVIAESALETGLLSARHTEGDFNATRPAPAGSVVVLDLTDGSVVAMASYPYFDPNQFVGGISTQAWEHLARPAAYSPLTNRAIQGLYAPGSTFKPFTALAGLEAGVIDLATTIDDRGVFELEPCDGDKCRWTNAGNASYGQVDLTRSLTVSSDVFYYSLGAQLATSPEGVDEATQDVARRFGFGSETGIQLPFERSGLVPDAAFKQERFDAQLSEYATWFVGDTINLAIGQGDLLATPLQLANAYATLATGGVRQQPNIVSRVVDRPSEELVREFDTRRLAAVDVDTPVSSVVWEALTGGLIGAVGSEEGTASTAFAQFPLSGFPVAGKTGTAQQFGRNPVTGNRREDTALFVGYAPVDDPRYVVAVVLEEAGFGGRVAAPVARQVLEALFELERTGDLDPNSAAAGSLDAAHEDRGELSSTTSP